MKIFILNSKGFDNDKIVFDRSGDLLCFSLAL